MSPPPTNYTHSHQGKSTTVDYASSPSPTLETNNYSTNGNITPQRNVRTPVQSFSHEDWHSRNSPILPTTTPATTAHSLPGRTSNSNQVSPTTSRISITSSRSTTRTTSTKENNIGSDSESDDDGLLAPIFSTRAKKKNWPGTFAMLTKKGNLNEEGLDLAGMILASAKKSGYANSLARGKKKKWFETNYKHVWLKSPHGMFKE